MWVVDTCVLIDLLRRDEAFASCAADALDAKRAEGLTIAPLTYVELAPALGGDVPRGVFLCRLRLMRGCNSTAMRSGSTAFAPQFAGVGSADGSFDLQQLKCNEAADWSVQFCELASNGLAGDLYTWTADEGCLDPDYAPVVSMGSYPMKAAMTSLGKKS